MNQKDAEAVRNLYAEILEFYKIRDDADKEIRKIKYKLSRVVSKYYWDFSYRLFELERVFEIPFQQIHLFANPTKKNEKCAVCGGTVETFPCSRAQFLNERELTCSSRCQLIRMGEDPDLPGNE